MKMATSGTRRAILAALILLFSGNAGLALEPRFPSADLPATQQPLIAGAAYHAPLHDEGVDWCPPPSCGDCPGFFAGAEFLLVRPHFSEAVAFARGTQGPASFHIVEEPLDFDYQSSLRAMVGYRGGPGNAEIRFTYWHMRGDTAVADGNPGPGQFIVDPFGNLVGTAFVIDPGDARFMTPLVGGDSIATTARVQLNIFDIDLGTSAFFQNPHWSVDVLAGVRIAQVDQFYDSVIRDAGGNVLTRGDFSVDFVGAGPRLGSGVRRTFGRDRQFDLFAKGAGALVLGQYNLAFSNSVGPFQGSQTQSMTRLIPVVDAEVGGSWRMTDRWTVAGGWLFQGWFDLGTSGGKFNGFFSGTDDANIMSMDGLFLRAEMTF